MSPAFRIVRADFGRDAALLHAVRETVFVQEQSVPAALERDALNGSVRLLPWAGRAMPITAFLVRHRDKHPSAAMRAFAQMAEALIPRPESIEAGAS